MKLNEPFLDIIAIGAINYDCIFFCDRVRRISDTASAADVGEVPDHLGFDVALFECAGRYLLDAHERHD